MIRLVIRADDAASCPESNRGIAACVDAGTVRCVSVMAPCAYVAEAATLLAGRTDCELGLHVTLNAEWETVRWKPVSPAAHVPSLIGTEGYFLPLPGDLKTRGFVVDEAMAEVAAQLSRLRSAGLNPVYMDEHCYAGWISPELVAALEAFAGREGLLPATRRLPGLPGDGNDYAARVRAAPPGDYVLVTHPAMHEPDGLLEQCHLRGELASGAVARDRAAEQQVLCRPQLRAELLEAGATLVSYTEILNS